MANTMRWRYGDTNPVILPIVSAVVVEIGDLLYLENGLAKPAGDQADQAVLLDNQEEFHNNFIGVAMQSSPAGEDQSIRVATAGVFEFDCVSAAFNVGDLIGVDEDSSGTKLENQVVAGVNNKIYAIGRCAKRVSPAATRVLIDIISGVMRGGPQATV